MVPVLEVVLSHLVLVWFEYELSYSELVEYATARAALVPALEQVVVVAVLAVVQKQAAVHQRR